MMCCPACEADTHNTLYKAVYTPTVRFFDGCVLLQEEQVELIRCDQCVDKVDRKLREKWTWQRHEVEHDITWEVPEPGS